MTVETTSGGTPANYDPEEYGDIGLEDVGVGDVVIPRLQIQHSEGTFKNNLTSEVYESLNVVLLGLVKQRIMWDDEVDDGDKPLCKSPDFEHGFPNVRDDIPKDKRFPWDSSNFEPANFSAEKGLNGLVTLPCNSCVFKEWNKQGWKNPPCAEQHTYPLLYNPGDIEDDNWIPALLTLQKTGIKPSRQYISGFAQSKTPMFTALTQISLTLQSRGAVKYSVPNFRRIGATERHDWAEYAQHLRSIREFIRQPPRRPDEDEETPKPSSNENTAPEAAEPAAKTKEQPKEQPKPEPAAETAAASSGDDDDLPF